MQKKTLIFFIIFGLITLGCSTSSNPPIQEFNASNESNSIKAVFISEPTQNDGASTSENRFSATIKITQALLDSMNSNQKVFFVGYRNSFKKLSSIIKDERLNHILSKPYMWLQDLFEFSWTGEKTEVLISYGNISMLPTVQSIISSVFPENSVQVKIVKSNAVHGTTGGNIEFWPGNIGVMGTSDFSDTKSIRSFEKQIFKDQLVLNLPTSWLTIGHVDELVKVLRYSTENDCSVDFLINSPTQALNVLSNHINSPFLDELEWGNTRSQQIDSIQKICKLGKIPCENLKNEDIVELIKKNQHILDFQNYAEKMQIKTKKIIEKAYSKQLPNCKVNWIYAPALYLGQRDKRKKSIVRGSGQSIFPSLTNGVLINNTYIVADPGNPVFRENFRKQMKASKFNVSFVPLGKETFFGKPFDGHIHCMTQVLRTQ